MSAPILVAGGAGFIGATTAHHLHRAGYRPIILDDLSRGHRRFIGDLDLVEADVADVPRVAEVLRRERVEAVLHFAARIEVGESVRRPLTHYRTNVAGTVGLLEAMERAEVKRIVFSSSAAVYGAPDEVPIREEHALAPMNPYGQSKAMMEQIIADCGKASALSWIALRYFNAAGADLDLVCGEWHDPETHLIPNALRAAAGLLPELALFGTDHPTADGTAVRDYVHVADLARAHVAAVGALMANEGESLAAAYNLGTGRGYSVREVIDTVARVTGRQVPFRELPIRAGDPPTLVAKAAAARAALGWTPQRSELESIVGDAWRWFQRHGFSAA